MINIPTLEEGRKEDGNRSIADKILKRLHDLEKTVEYNQGRWVWELLQNAKDSIFEEEERKVSVEITINSNSVCFKHNGTHFTEIDIRGLINQISSKEVEVGQVKKKTGKFGTGFLTTHLLSKKIKIEGIVESKELKFYKFSFILDRDGKTTTDLIPKIEKSWNDFQNGALLISDVFDKNDIKTSFTYEINSEVQKRIAQIGLSEFEKLIPYVLIFNPKIESVSINDQQTNKCLTYKYPESESLSGIKYLKEISKIENGIESKILLLKVSLSNQRVQTAIEIIKNIDGYEIKDINNIPKLFCDFPLIGSEKFHFPIVINSFYFNPTTERDGIWLKGSDDTEVLENQTLIDYAFYCYKEMVKHAVNLKFNKLYNLVDTRIPAVEDKNFDRSWYQSKVQLSMRKFLLEQEIISTPSGEMKSLKEIRIPSKELNNEVADKLYKFYSDLNPELVCVPEDANHWKPKMWDGCIILDFERMLNSIETKNSIEGLFRELGLDETNGWIWFNEVCNFILSFDSNIILFEKKKIIPNQYGELCHKFDDFNEPNLYIDRIKDTDLLDILKILGNDWRSILLHKCVKFGRYHEKKKDDIATEISNLLRQANLSLPSSKNAISQLFQWFESNIEEGKELFPDLYKRRAEMFLNTISDKDSLYKIMRSKIDLAEIADLAIAIENDPEILNIIRKRQQEQQEEYERNIIGEFVEQLLAEVLIENGFTVTKNHVGSDLIISLDGKFFYDIEVKSISSAGFVKLTPTQAYKAVNNSEYYALCVVQKDGTILTKEYVRENVKFITNIGDLLNLKVREMDGFQTNQNQISSGIDDIGIIFENTLEFRYKIGSRIWSNGIGIEDFVLFLNELS